MRMKKRLEKHRQSLKMWKIFQTTYFVTCVWILWLPPRRAVPRQCLNSSLTKTTSPDANIIYFTESVSSGVNCKLDNELRDADSHFRCMQRYHAQALSGEEYHYGSFGNLESVGSVTISEFQGAFIYPFAMAAFARQSKWHHLIEDASTVLIITFSLISESMHVSAIRICLCVRLCLWVFYFTCNFPSR